MSTPGLATLSAQGVGSISAWTTGLSYSVQVSAQEDQSREGRGYYPTAVSVSQFSVTFAFPTWPEAEAFSNWLVEVGARCASPSLAQAPVVVSVPSSNFVRSGIPAGGMEQGDSFGTMVYTFAVTFTGTTDPVFSSGSQTTIGLTKLTPETQPSKPKGFLGLITGLLTPKSGAELFFPSTTPGAGKFTPTQPLVETLEQLSATGRAG